MKHIILFLSLLLLAFDIPIENIKSSYGHIEAYYKMQPKQELDCENCFTSMELFQEVSLINKKLMSMAYVKASSFVVKKKKTETISMTSEHVCKEISIFLKDQRFKELAKELMKTMAKSYTDEELYTKIYKSYEIVPKAYIYSFEGVKHEIKSILLSDSNIDTCAIETLGSWGKEVTFAKGGCVYEKIFNMSSSGGYYYKGSAALREGYVNGRVEELSIQQRKFKEVNLYTLLVKPGASGSAVFNVKGEVCGSVNISFIKVDLSAGASFIDLNQFYKQLK
jgi:hypothetical protein